MHGRHPHTPRLDPGFDTGSTRQGGSSGDTATLELDEPRPSPRTPTNGPLVVLLIVAALVGAIAIAFGGRDDDPALQIGDTAEPATDLAVAEAPESGGVQGLTGAGVVDGPAEDAADDVSEAVAERPSVDLEGCMLTVIEIKLGSEGESVECLQKALYAAGYYDGEFTGAFDSATDVAVRAVQDDRDLYVDGIVGANTATSLGIWPGDESFIVKTPVPPQGAKDLWGMALSPVASAGDDAPPLPDNAGQGTGYRVVYSRAMQRVWAINDAEQIVRSYLVTGSQYRNEVPGIHKIYSRSETTTAWNGAATLPLMVRWLDTERGAIGFHAIPKDRETGEPYQTWQELGQKMSGGCQRQHMLDAQFMWAFGTIGTPVYVL